jgi:hypothetical protein
MEISSGILLGWAALTVAIASGLWFTPKSFLLLVLSIAVLVLGSGAASVGLFEIISFTRASRQDTYDLPTERGKHSLTIGAIPGGGGYQATIAFSKEGLSVSDIESCRWQVDSAEKKVHIHTAHCEHQPTNHLFDSPDLRAPFKLEYSVDSQTAPILEHSKLVVSHTWVHRSDNQTGYALGKWILLISMSSSLLGLTMFIRQFSLRHMKSGAAPVKRST